jgi:hypothetical protein
VTTVELQTLAADICEGRVFTGAMAQKAGTLDMSFPILLLADAATRKRIAAAGEIYEYLDRASPRAVNGCPIFFSCRTMSKAEVVKVRRMMTEYLKLRERFEREGL